MTHHHDLGVPVGDGEYASPAKFLLMSAFLVYEAKKAGSDVRLAARNILDEIFESAKAGGFMKGEILETLMSRCEKSQRVWTLAVEATEAIGDTEAFMSALRRAGIRTEGVE
ncbi:hypothetical protein [Paraburkholderia terricola]|jgi:hypothetical protein|uniref:Uncharacterized protein n=1 Tax=Paraburkholderia terricola TaxID=169427 RepID=A0A1M6LHB6_9BURK|nr:MULTISPECIES: hypothetical protein [Paraburkholderia]SDN86616.1 hypothetical protein SAMN05192547_1005115 [Paraburkholderia sediminicola]SHJ70573.1 hypothetical protein SAMN05192548_1005116 [Paraburkholderia terricola]